MPPELKSQLGMIQKSTNRDIAVVPKTMQHRDSGAVPDFLHCRRATTVTL
jgi:hypothetical protein